MAWLDRHFAPAAVRTLSDIAEQSVLPGSLLASGHLYGRWADWAAEQFTTVTLLRHPVARAVSQYSYWRSLDPALQLAPSDRHQVELARRFSLPALLDAGDPIVDGSFRNLQTQMLGLPRARSPGGPHADRAVLDAALQRLARIDCVGTTERLQETALLLAARIGWLPEPRLPKINTSSDIGEIDPRTLDRLAEMNGLDLELHAAAEARLAAAVATLRSPALRAEVEARLGRHAVADRRYLDLGGPFVGTGWGPREADELGSWRETSDVGAELLFGPMPETAAQILLTLRGDLPLSGDWLCLNGTRLALEMTADGSKARAEAPAGSLRQRSVNRLEVMHGKRPLSLRAVELLSTPRLSRVRAWARRFSGLGPGLAAILCDAVARGLPYQ